MKVAQDGQPWCIHGVAFDISDIKRIEEQLQEERNFVSAILDTVGALVVVLDSEGRILRFNPACELTTGYSMEEVQGKYIWDLFLLPEETDRFRATFEVLRTDPVSYTHLDVYKRQVFHCARGPTGAKIIATTSDRNVSQLFRKLHLNFAVPCPQYASCRKSTIRLRAKYGCCLLYTSFRTAR